VRRSGDTPLRPSFAAANGIPASPTDDQCNRSTPGKQLWIIESKRTEHLVAPDAKLPSAAWSSLAGRNPIHFQRLIPTRIKNHSSMSAFNPG
jgi:hypothetical protein